ncbi:MAG: hypothetical protein ACK4YO_03715, partial [Candidatus Altarchaeaceae archaeon]
SSAWLSSYGDNNTCNSSKADGWNDAGITGCRYICAQCSANENCSDNQIFTPAAQNKTMNPSIPEENTGNTIKLNLGKDMKGAEVKLNVGGKESKGKVDENGDIVLQVPAYGSGQITISKQGYNEYKKSMTFYAGELKISKISGEKPGDKFKFKVIDQNGNPVKDADVEISGEKLRTNEEGIVEMEIKTVQTNLLVSVSKGDYKSGSLVFDIKPMSEEKPAPSEETKVNTTMQFICGDGKCNGEETKENCPQDCKKPDDMTRIIAVIVVILLLRAIYLLFIKRRKKKEKE